MRAADPRTVGAALVVLYLVAVLALVVLILATSAREAPPADVMPTECSPTPPARGWCSGR